MKDGEKVGLASEDRSAVNALERREQTTRKRVKERVAESGEIEAFK